jgi:ribosomal protein S18 acetylase RimI-like enzyme
MKKGKARYFFFILRTLLVCVLQNPLRIGVILGVMKQAGGRGGQDETGLGEYLSLGVLPEYAQARDEKTGLRIPNLLFERVIEYFGRHGFKEILLMIRKTNKKSQMFYHSYGAAMKSVDFVPADCYLMAVKVAHA